MPAPPTGLGAVVASCMPLPCAMSVSEEEQVQPRANVFRNES